MTEIPNNKLYDLEERTFQFAKRCRDFIKKLSKTTCNIEDGKQLARSSGSVGANYIEANEAISKKDFLLRIRISRKESKETLFWLRLVDTSGISQLETERMYLMQEVTELMKILSAIMRKSEEHT
jgi:four helix bundle protein